MARERRGRQRENDGVTVRFVVLAVVLTVPVAAIAGIDGRAA